MEITERKLTINGTREMPIEIECPELEFGKDYDITLRVSKNKEELCDKDNGEFYKHFKTKVIHLKEVKEVE
jgi:hypothetical protein